MRELGGRRRSRGDENAKGRVKARHQKTQANKQGEARAPPRPLPPGCTHMAMAELAAHATAPVPWSVMVAARSLKSSSYGAIIGGDRTLDRGRARAPSTPMPPKALAGPAVNCPVSK